MSKRKAKSRIVGAENQASTISGIGPDGTRQQLFDEGKDKQAIIGLNTSSIVPACFEGVRFRSAADREKCSQQVSVAHDKALAAIHYSDYQRREENEKGFHVEIQHLRDALKEEQDRHRADIIKHARQHRQPSTMELADERRY